jgi:heptosyltransferase-2
MHFGPNGFITGILKPYVRDVLAGSDLLDDIVEYDPHSSRRELRSRAVLEQIKSRKLDQVFLLPNSARPAILAWAAGIPHRIGYARYGRGPLLTKRLQPIRDGWQATPVSAVDYYLSLAKLVAVPIQGRFVELGTTDDDERMADAVWDRYQLHRSRVAVLNTGGAYGAAKRWPDEHFAELARRLCLTRDTRVIIICGRAERAAATTIQRLARHPSVISMADERSSIGLSKAVIRRADLLVTTDSGPRFFGEAFRVPTITIFGPTDPRWSQTGAPLSIELSELVPCGPCAKRICPLGHHRCMRSLGVDRVLAAAHELWVRHGQSKVA